MERFEEFIQERKYILNVSETTLNWYRASFKTWAKYSQGDPNQWVIGMRAAGISPRSVNTHICALNAYWKWNKEPFKLKYLKEEQKLITTRNEDQIRALVAFKPTATNLTRAHVAALVLIDTGIRASELIGLTREKIDLDNFLLRISGKGGKERLVPFSVELRKHLFKFRNQHAFVFGTKNRTKITIRNLERDIHKLGCTHLGIARLHPHLLRHTFSVNYLRRGGNLEYLRRILGHQQISTTQKYLRGLGIEDLQVVHNGLSLLTNGR